MPEIRAGGSKWKLRASQASRDYLAGVQRPRRNWQEATTSAAQSYADGVAQAISDGRFARGIARAGNSAYLKGVTTKGPTRYVEGINTSGDAYDRGFAPYAETIRNVQLPARGRRGDPANYQRTQQLGEALHQRRRDLLTST